MNTKSNVLVIEENAVFGHGFERVLSDKSHQVNTNLKAANDGKQHTLLSSIAMLITAPLVALAYVIALPFIGLYHFAKLAHEAYARKHPVAGNKLRKAGLFARNVGLFFASPFIALGYVIALPFVGFTMIARLALEAHAKRHANC